jgi:hypothetical protein
VTNFGENQGSADTGTHPQQQTLAYEDLPQEILDFHKDREQARFSRRAAAQKQNLDLQVQLKREAAMVRIDCPARGKAWKLRKGGDKRKMVDWARLLFVVTYDGDMIHDHETDPQGEPMLVGNLKNVIKHKVWNFNLFPGGAIELVFRKRDEQGGRVVNYLYMGWKQEDAYDFEIWQDALKRFTWR